MTDNLQALLEATIEQAAKDGVAFVGVTLEESPARITFWRNTRDNAHQLAQLFRTLAVDLDKGEIQEIRLQKSS